MTTYSLIAVCCTAFIVCWLQEVDGVYTRRWNLCAWRCTKACRRTTTGVRINKVCERRCYDYARTCSICPKRKFPKTCSQCMPGYTLVDGRTHCIRNIQSIVEDEYNVGFALGQQAFIYGLPLAIMQYTYEAQISTTPVNRFNYFRSFATPADTLVVAPNFDTLYATAWVDLSNGPVLLHLPQELNSTVNNITNRYWVIALYDPYTNNFNNLGLVSLTEPGDYAIAWRGHDLVEFPSQWKRIDSNYDRVWIIERIYAINDDAADIQFVNSLQDLITLTPLNHSLLPDWSGGSSPSGGGGTPSIPNGMAFYDQLCEQLARFPPPSEDDSFLSTLIPIGIMPGLKPSQNVSLSATKVAGMIAAISNGTATVRAEVVKMYKATFAAHNGYLVLPTGVYGTNYTLRAVIAQIGLGALTPDQAIYPVGLFDRTGKTLLGNQTYKVHIAAGGLPPVNAFWSLTMYTSNGFLVPNAINRYLINDRSSIYYNSDGSIDIYIQATSPSDPNQAQNWLPTPPNAPFQVIWRLYVIEPSLIPGMLSGQGWQPPAIMPVV